MGARGQNARHDDREKLPVHPTRPRFLGRRMSRSDIWALLDGHETPAWVVPSDENMMALRRGGFTSPGKRQIHLTGTGLPLCGGTFETGPRAAAVVQSSAVLNRFHPSDPLPFRDFAFP